MPDLCGLLYRKKWTLRRTIGPSAAAIASIGTALIVSASAALAQKAKDTARIGVYQPIAIVDSIFDPHPQTSLMSRMVFDTLVEFDSDRRQLMPALAESWSQIDPVTYEFRLRKGVKFHDGSEFDADDVVYTVNFVTDPNVRFRLKENRFGRLAAVEKIDKYTVRLRAKAPFAPLLSRLSSILPMYPSDHHGELADKSRFGRAPIGTGPYKATQVDSFKGVILSKNPDYKHGSSAKPAAKISRIVIEPIPDQQTQIARLMLGAQDLMYDVSHDLADNLRRQPNIEISVRPSVSFTYLMLDAADRSKVGFFRDKRVREAMIRAIDRKAIVEALQPREIASMPLQPAMCHGWHIGCSSTLAPPEYNIATARQLMAEAGHAGGFSPKISTWGPARPVAEAVAGQVRRIGIRATIEILTVPSFVKKRADGQLSAYIGQWDNAGGSEDVESTAAFFFLPGSLNYNGDPELAELVEAGRAEFNQVRREMIYARLFDKVTAERYAMPLVPLASVLAHSSEIKIPLGGTKKPEAFMFNLLEWQ
jgi:peptide/nickel transport system substrate-binding protein